MKKSALFVLGASILTLASCGGKTNSTESNGGETTKTVKVALVTDSGTLNDHNFNQTSWEAVNAWAVENGGGTVKDQIVSNGNVLTKYYQPTAVGGDFTTTERVAAIKAAADWGANFIVLPGYLFQPVVKQVQANAKYKDIHFLALDCVNQDSDNGYAEYTLQKNVSMTQYHEEQAGFMAGYGAVKEGLRNLGFIGGMAVPAVVRYGYGAISKVLKKLQPNLISQTMRLRCNITMLVFLLLPLKQPTLLPAGITQEQKVSSLVVVPSITP